MNSLDKLVNCEIGSFKVVDSINHAKYGVATFIRITILAFECIMNTSVS